MIQNNLRYKIPIKDIPKALKPLTNLGNSTGRVYWSQQCTCVLSCLSFIPFYDLPLSYYKGEDMMNKTLWSVHASVFRFEKIYTSMV